MHLGSIYLVVKDFEQTIRFYEQLLEMSVTRRNMERFAQFEFEGHNISVMNAFFDRNNPDKVVFLGRYEDELDNKARMGTAENTNKFVLNFWVEDLRTEHQRISNLQITQHLTGIKYLNAGQPYYYFQLMDPDDNIIEITGCYQPSESEF